MFPVFLKEITFEIRHFALLRAFSLQAQKLNQQPTVMYDMGYREEGIDNKGLQGGLSNTPANEIQDSL